MRQRALIGLHQRFEHRGGIPLNREFVARSLGGADFYIETLKEGHQDVFAVASIPYSTNEIEDDLRGERSLLLRSVQPIGDPVDPIRAFRGEAARQKSIEGFGVDE